MSVLPPPPFPAADDVQEIADWAELIVLCTGRRISRGILRSTLSREEAVSRTAADDVWSELAFRRDVIGTRWPLILDGQILRPRRKIPPVHYLFLAALGLRYNIDSAGREHFEHFVTEIVAGLTGTAGLRIGYPRRSPIPMSLADAVTFYCAQSEELAGRLLPPPLTDGDLGLDVVSWLTLRDKRGGYLHFIGQCATGADWRDKLTELNTHKWGDHVNWAVPPVRFFATPFVVHAGDFRRVTLDGGLILDRPRLLELATRARPTKSLTRTIKTYLGSVYA